MARVLLWILVAVAATSCVRSQYRHWGYGPAVTDRMPMPGYGPFEMEGPTTTPGSYAQSTVYGQNRGNYWSNHDPRMYATDFSKQPMIDTTTVPMGAADGQGTYNPHQNIWAAFFKILLKTPRNKMGIQDNGPAPTESYSNTNDSYTGRKSHDQLGTLNSVGVTLTPQASVQYQSIETTTQSKQSLDVKSYQNKKIPSNKFLPNSKSEIKRKLTNSNTVAPNSKHVIHDSEKQTGRNHTTKTVNSGQKDHDKVLTILRKLLLTHVSALVDKGEYPQSNTSTVVYTSKIKQLDNGSVEIISPEVFKKQAMVYVKQLQNTLSDAKKPLSNNKPASGTNMPHEKQIAKQSLDSLSPKTNLLSIPRSKLSSDRRGKKYGTNKTQSLKNINANRISRTELVNKITNGKNSSMPPNEPSPRLYSSYPRLLPALYPLDTNRTNPSSVNTSINGASQSVETSILKPQTPGKYQRNAGVGVSTNNQESLQQRPSNSMSSQNQYKEIVTASKISYQHKTDQPFPPETSTHLYNFGKQFANKYHMTGSKYQFDGHHRVAPVSTQGAYRTGQQDSYLNSAGSMQTNGSGQYNSELSPHSSISLTNAYAPTATGNSSNTTQDDTIKQYLLFLSWFVDTALNKMANGSTPGSVSSQTAAQIYPPTSSVLADHSMTYPPYAPKPHTHQHGPVTKSQTSTGIHSVAGTVSADQQMLNNNGPGTPVTTVNGQWNQYLNQQLTQSHNWQEPTASNTYGATTPYLKHQTLPSGASSTQPNGKYPCRMATVCGDDGKTYLSNCFLPATVNKACDGSCPCPVKHQAQTNVWNQANTHQNPTINSQTSVKPKTGPTSAAQKICISKCPTVHEPVCSSRGITHSSDCHLKCSNETKMCNAICPCEFEEVLPAMRRTLVNIDELLAAQPGTAQNSLQQLVPDTPQCACPVADLSSLFVCTHSGRTRTPCQARCLGETIACYQTCPCVVEW